jgi:HEPN domain-containing protein
MPPPEKGGPGHPQEWLKRARSNLAIAKAALRVRDIYLEDACFQAQQAAEKAIKAVLLHLRISFPYTHDLTALLRLLKNAGRAVPGEVEQAGLLTRFAIATRYPGLAEPVTRKETEKAIKIADSALRWARKSIGKER